MTSLAWIDREYFDVVRPGHFKNRNLATNVADPSGEGQGDRPNFLANPDRPSFQTAAIDKFSRVPKVARMAIVLGLWLRWIEQAPPKR